MKPHSDIDFIQAYLDGQLSHEQTVALENRLRTDRKLAELLLRVSREEAILTEWSGSQAAVAGKITPNKPRSRRAAPASRRRWIAAAVVLITTAAAAIALAWLGFTSLPNNNTAPGPGPVARADSPELKVG